MVLFYWEEASSKPMLTKEISFKTLLEATSDWMAMFYYTWTHLY